MTKYIKPSQGDLANQFLDYSSPENVIGAGADLKCPTCGENYNHVWPIGGPYASHPAHASITDNYDAWWGRGGLLCIPVECENCGLWTLALGSHKGFTTMFAHKGFIGPHSLSKSLDFKEEPEEPNPIEELEDDINTMELMLHAFKERLKKVKSTQLESNSSSNNK